MPSASTQTKLQQIKNYWFIMSDSLKYILLLKCYVSLHWSKNKIEKTYSGEVKTGLGLGPRLYFNRTGHTLAFLNQQFSSKFDIKICLNRLVVMYWYAHEG